ncbi:hypothetical protein [Azonexus sp. IMCC34839]|uniref:hypothetical protein n=1 Tax=Azonexus sp. IMCC34839 TaxID=3133695 RepID=UPI00399BDC2E
MDFATQNRQLIINSVRQLGSAIESCSDVEKRLEHSNQMKRIRAINTLGSKWVLHPEYDSCRCAHHSTAFKKSAVLEVFLQGRMAREMGRV